MVKKIGKKITSVILIIVFICFMPSVESKATSITTDTVQSRLNALRNQYPKGSSWNKQFAGGTQCYAFAHYVFNNIFGRGSLQVGNGAISSNPTCYKLNNVASDIVTVGILEPGYSSANLEKLLESARPGDYLQVKRSSSGNPHSMIVINVDANANSVGIFDANYVAKNTVGQYTETFTEFKKKNCGVSLYRYKDYVIGNNPTGNVDSICGGTGEIKVGGWAFDVDDVSKSLEIHVYIGGEAGSGAEGHKIQANKERPDVGKVYAGVGDYHGFDDAITTTCYGLQSIYVYAINIGSGTSALIGKGEVEIKGGNVASTTNKVPITCYTLSNTQNVNTYTAVNGTYTGYICPNDQCKINAVYDSGWVQVSYPTASGTKTAYAKSSDFFCSTNFSTSTINAGKDINVYRKANLSSALGTVYGTDDILVIGTSNGNTQILYPISGGYKLGFVSGNPFVGSGAETGGNTSVTAEKFFEKAKGQLGVKERSSGSDDIIYNDWYYGRRVNNNDGNFYPWCAAFVSWCANECGLLGDVIPRTNNTTNMKNSLLNLGGTLHLKGTGYLPVKGDIIFFGNNAGQHVGIVDYSSGNTVYYIDGNNVSTTPHSVHYSSCSLSYDNLYGFVTPAYKTSTDNTAPEIKDVSISSVDGNGYTITATVTDNCGIRTVSCATWTDDGGQDDLIWREMNIQGNKVSVYIPYEEHGNKMDSYINHIYAYDTGSKHAAYGIHYERGENLGNSFYGKIKNVASGNYVANDECNVVSETKRDSLEQLWKFELQEDGSYKIICCYDGNVLDVEGNRTEDRTNIICCDSNNGLNQRWYFCKNGSGYNLVPASAKGSTIDCWLNDKSDGANIVLHKIVDKDEAAIYKVEKVTSTDSYKAKIASAKFYKEEKLKNESYEAVEGGTVYMQVKYENAYGFEVTVSCNNQKIGSAIVSGKDEQLCMYRNLEVGTYQFEFVPKNYLGDGKKVTKTITVKSKKVTATTTPKPTATKKPTATATSTPKPTKKPTGTPTPTPKPTATKKPTGTPTETPTPKLTVTSAPTATPTTKPTVTKRPTEIPTFVQEVTVYPTKLPDYTGEDDVEEILEIDEAEIVLLEENYVFDGMAKKPDVMVVMDNLVLEEGMDYVVSYKNNTNIGEASVIITGKGNYRGVAEQTFQIKIEKGMIINKNDCKYKIINSKEVEFYRLTDDECSKVVIPKEVSIGGKRFKVTVISSKALKDTEITQVIIGDNVKIIKNSAFENCSKLTKVTMGSRITKIGSNCLKNCKKLKKISIESKKLKSVGSNVFKGTKSDIRIKVSKSKVKTYKKLFKKKGQQGEVRVVK